MKQIQPHYPATYSSCTPLSSTATAAQDSWEAFVEENWKEPLEDAFGGQWKETFCSEVIAMLNLSLQQAFPSTPGVPSSQVDPIMSWLQSISFEGCLVSYPGDLVQELLLPQTQVVSKNDGLSSSQAAPSCERALETVSGGEVQTAAFSGSQVLGMPWSPGFALPPVALDRNNTREASELAAAEGDALSEALGACYLTNGISTLEQVPLWP